MSRGIAPAAAKRCENDWPSGSVSLPPLTIPAGDVVKLRRSVDEPDLRANRHAADRWGNVQPSILTTVAFPSVGVSPTPS